jgi:hypothetical protein
MVRTNCTLQLWVKTSTGTISVVAEHGMATTVADMRAQIAEGSGLDITVCR